MKNGSCSSNSTQELIAGLNYSQEYLRQTSGKAFSCTGQQQTCTGFPKKLWNFHHWWFSITSYTNISWKWQIQMILSRWKDLHTPKSTFPSAFSVCFYALLQTPHLAGHSSLQAAPLPATSTRANFTHQHLSLRAAQQQQILSSPQFSYQLLRAGAKQLHSSQLRRSGWLEVTQGAEGLRAGRRYF